MISLGKFRNDNKKVDLEVFVNNFEVLHAYIHEVNERVYKLRLLIYILFFMYVIFTVIL